MIQRELQVKLQQMAQKFPFVAVTGPRQSGKSTLVRSVFSHYQYVSLEDLEMRAFAQDDPKGFIKTYPNHTIIDEVQRVPQLLSYLQTHCDLQNEEGMYILTGSQNMLLMNSIDQSLAGRVAILHLLPFSHYELQNSSLLKPSVNEEIFYGGYPRLYDKNIEPTDYYPNYIRTYVERDLRLLHNIGDLSKFVKCMKLCAGRIGQMLNISSIANECGCSVPTVSSWISILETSFIVYLLRPDHKNFSKRLVKTPKLYFYDTGLACSLLEINSAEQIANHYMRGELFENLVINEFFKSSYNKGLEPNYSFWRDNTGHEIDLIKTNNDKQLAFEIKSGATFSSDFYKGLTYWGNLSKVTSDERFVIYGGENQYTSTNGIACPWKEIENLLQVAQ